MLKSRKQVLSSLTAITLFISIALPISANGLTAPEDETEEITITLQNPGELLEMGGENALTSEDILNNFTIITRDLDGETGDARPDLDENSQNAAVQDSGKTAIAAPMALADLRVANLRHEKHSMPFPLNVDIPFRFDVRNSGEVIARSPKITYYIDNTLIGSAEIGSIEPGGIKNIEVDVGGAMIGTYTLTVKVNATKTIEESDYTNNQVSGEFTWGGDIPDTGLVAYAFFPEDNQTEFSQGSLKGLEMSIFNSSSNDFSNVQVRTQILSGETVVRTKVIDTGSLPAHNLRQNIGIYIMLEETGNLTVRMEVLAPEGYSDPVTSDNIRELHLVSVPKLPDKVYDLHFLSGKWANKTPIDISMDESVDVLSEDEFIMAPKHWNDVTSNVAKITYYVSPKNTAVTVTQIEGTIESNPKAIAVTTLLDKELYKSAKITLSKEWFDKFIDKDGFTATQRKIACVAHELGHVLGLDHATCNSPSIMAEGILSDNYSAKIEDHDRYNVYKRYN